MLKRFWKEGRSAQLCTHFPKRNDLQAGQSDQHRCTRVCTRSDMHQANLSEVGRCPNLPLSNLKIWQGWKESNLRMPESKSGALTNLATPLHGTVVVANNRPINHLLLKLSQKLSCPVSAESKSSPAFYQPANGCTSRLLHLRTRQPPGALAKFTSCGSCANTALPEPVIRP